MFELGVYTFGDLPRGTGGAESAKQRLDEIVAAAKLADELGLSAFGVGEHHRSDFAVSSPAVVLGALANATKSIKLTTAVTILSSADPVRVFEDFATVDLLSAGRAELIIGRGAFVESFPLFGYQLDDYNELYDEKLELLLKIRDQDPVSWQGKFRSALHDAEISPRPLAGIINSGLARVARRRAQFAPVSSACRSTLPTLAASLRVSNHLSISIAVPLSNQDLPQRRCASAYPVICISIKTRSRHCGSSIRTTRPILVTIYPTAIAAGR